MKVLQNIKVPTGNILIVDAELKDKNGKEIYEGDIVTQSLYWDISKKDIVYFEVVYEKDGFKLKDKKGNISFIGEFNKIVGNIYENPELLNQ